MTASLTRPSRRHGLSDRQVKALKKQSKRYTVADPELRGHYVRVMPKGANTFVTVTRDPYGKQVWTTIGSSDVLSINEARDQAREIIKRVKAGQPAVEPPPVKPDSFKSVAENWFKRHVEAKGLRTQYEIRRCLNKYVFPHWAEIEFASIRRSHITRLLDHIQDNNGARQADATLAIVHSISNWYAIRHDDYATPFTRGMRRSDRAKRARARILNDGELRTIWKAAEANGVFGAIVRLALLTGQRREKLITMKWDDISGDTWHIASEEREKGHAGSLVLPQLALDIIHAQPRYASNPYVFAGRKGGYCSGIAALKARFDAKLPPTPNWTLHDLRRTARSLMSRAGVQRDHAERVLGHAIPGVEGVYDRHDYRDEKADALQRLADLIERIINGTAGDNVIALRPSATAQS